MSYLPVKSNKSKQKCAICGRELSRITLAHLRSHGVKDWEEYNRIVSLREGKNDFLLLYRIARVGRLMKSLDCLDNILMSKANDPDVELRDLVALANYFSRDLSEYLEEIRGSVGEGESSFSGGLVGMGFLAEIPSDPRDRFILIQRARRALADGIKDSGENTE